MVPAEVAQRNLCKPDGSVELCWVVTAKEPGGDSTVVFSGVECAGRSAAYARANYAPITFRMLLEPGQLGFHGRQIGEGNGRVQ